VRKLFAACKNHNEEGDLKCFHVPVPRETDQAQYVVKGWQGGVTSAAALGLQQVKPRAGLTSVVYKSSRRAKGTRRKILFVDDPLKSTNKLKNYRVQKKRAKGREVLPVFLQNSAYSGAKGQSKGPEPDQKKKRENLDLLTPLQVRKGLVD